MKKVLAIAFFCSLLLGGVSCSDPMEDEIKPALQAPVIKTPPGGSNGEAEKESPPGSDSN